MNARESKETQFYYRLRKTVRVWAGGERSRANKYADFVLTSHDWPAPRRISSTLWTLSLSLS
jgi:hypothetical protein